MSKKGRMDVLKFFEDYKKFFPTLWIIVQREAARRVVEVGVSDSLDFLDKFHHPDLLG